MKINKTNSLKLLIIGYSLTFIGGCAVVLPFIIKRAASLEFHVTVAEAGFVFGFFMLGMVCTQFLNGFLIEKISIKKELYIISFIYLMCVVWMYNMTSFIMLLPILFIIGLVFGIVVTIPHFLFVHAFKGIKRSSNLNRLDISFSLGSMLWPLLAGAIVAVMLPWQTVYLSLIIVWIFILIMISITKLPDVSSKHLKETNESFSKWNKYVWLTGLAMFIYFVSQVGFIYWVAYYLQHRLHMNAATSNFGVTLFWFFYMIGCFISSFALKKIQVNKYIIGSMVIAAISFGVIIISPTPIVMMIAISFFGLGCATIYESTISFGSQMLDKPSPKLVGFFITLSGIGTLVGQYYSSYIVGRCGIIPIIWISAILMIIGICLYFVVSVSQKDNPRLKINNIKQY